MKMGNILVEDSSGNKLLIAIAKITFIKEQTEKFTTIGLQCGRSFEARASFAEILNMAGHYDYE